MRVPLVDLGWQHERVADAVARGWSEVVAGSEFVLGARVEAFEEAFAATVGVRHCVGVANGTDAIELALRANGIGRGDEVLVPANSFVASASAVVRAGATPVFVDVDPETALIDVDAAAAVAGPACRAVVAVHLFGQMADMAAVAALADILDLVVVEDAAQAQGARQDGRAAGAAGAAGAFSFYPGKNLGAYGDAGAVVTDDDDVARRLRRLRNHGGDEKYEHPELGFNSRLDPLQAVVLSAKLPHLDDWNRRRRAAAEVYDALLGCVPEVDLVQTAPGNTSARHLYCVLVPSRDRVLSIMRDQGIGASVHYPRPLHLEGAFAPSPPAHCPVAERLAGELLTLPLHPGISRDQQHEVVGVLIDALESAVGAGARRAG